MLLVIVFLITIFSWSAPVFRDAEAILYDLRASLLMEEIDQDDRIVILTYDEKTVFESRKHSPLDRSLLARSLTKLDGLKPKMVGLDFIFDQTTDADEELLTAIRNSDTLTKIALVNIDENHKSTWADPDVSENAMRIEREFHRRAKTANVESVDVSLRLDVGRVVRTWPTVSTDKYDLMSHALSGDAGELKMSELPINFKRAEFADGDGVFLKISLHEFLDTFTAEQLQPIIEGKTVLIGLDTQGSDEFNTPMSIISRGEMTAGVEIHATMLAQILDNRWSTPIPPILIWICGLGVICLASLTAFSDMRNSRLVPLLFLQFSGLIAVPFLLHALGFDSLNIPAFGWPVCWILALIIVTSLAKSVGADKRKFAQGALGKYLPDEVAQQIIADPEKLTLRGEKREIYALFSDLQGFTKLSHAIEPEMVAVLLNKYLQMLSETVLEHGGTIDKFVGDAVVAFWGAPIARANDPERAVNCAIAIWQRGEEFRKSAPEGVPPVGITRVGLHFGEAIVGNFGGDDRIQYTALGDSMNTAARLESANKQTGTGILISEDVTRKLDGSRVFQRLGRITLSGRSTPVAICQPVQKDQEQFVIKANALYAEFDEGNVQARERLVELRNSRPTDVSFCKFCDRLEKIGPGDSYVLESK